MHLMLQQGEPDDFVIATGESHKLAEFASVAFEHLGLDVNDYLVSDKKASKAASKLGWSQRYKMVDVARMIVDACAASEEGAFSNLRPGPERMSGDLRFRLRSGAYL